MCFVQDWEIGQALTTVAAGGRSDDAFALALQLNAGNKVITMLFCTEVPLAVSICAGRDGGGFFDFDRQLWVTSCKGKGKGGKGTHKE